MHPTVRHFSAPFSHFALSAFSLLLGCHIYLPMADGWGQSIVNQYHGYLLRRDGDISTRVVIKFLFLIQMVKKRGEIAANGDNVEIRSFIIGC